MTFFPSSNAVVSAQWSDIEKLSSNSTMWCSLLPPNKPPNLFCTIGWATSKIAPTIAAMRNSNRSNCLSMTHVRLRFWLNSKNSIAAQCTFWWRIRLMRWITTGRAISPAAMRDRQWIQKTWHGRRFNLLLSNPDV